MLEPCIDAHSHIWTPDVAHHPLAKGFTVEDMQPRSLTAEERLGHYQAVAEAQVPDSVGRRTTSLA